MTPLLLLKDSAAAVDGSAAAVDGSAAAGDDSAAAVETPLLLLIPLLSFYPPSLSSAFSHVHASSHLLGVACPNYEDSAAAVDDSAAAVDSSA